MIKLSVHADDKGSYFLDFALVDKNKDPAVPSVLTWTLLGPEKQVINSRLQVPIDPPVSSGAVVLHGDDLNYDDGEFRYFVLEGTYDSDEQANLPLRKMARFFIDDIAEPAESP